MNEVHTFDISGLEPCVFYDAQPFEACYGRGFGSLRMPDLLLPHWPPLIIRSSFRQTQKWCSRSNPDWNMIG